MMKPYTCLNAREDIKLFFSIGPSVAEGESAFWRAMKHIIHGDIIKHRIVCKKCWRYHLRIKRETVKKSEKGGLQ